jgi:organic hydroperoxide reductase OsmC/OhrA
MLWYLHLCAEAHILVTGYVDHATGAMAINDDGGGHFTEVLLKPEVTIRKDSDSALASELHHRAHELCFIANSVNFEVRVESTIRTPE